MYITIKETKCLFPVQWYILSNEQHFMQLGLNFANV